MSEDGFQAKDIIGLTEVRRYSKIQKSLLQ